MTVESPDFETGLRQTLCASGLDQRARVEADPFEPYVANGGIQILDVDGLRRFHG